MRSLTLRRFASYLLSTIEKSDGADFAVSEHDFRLVGILAPIGSQEVWAAGADLLPAAGSARMAERRTRVERLLRPCVFRGAPGAVFKATESRVAAPEEMCAFAAMPSGRCRSGADAPDQPAQPDHWLHRGHDMSSRDIEARTRSICRKPGLRRQLRAGSGILVSSEPLAPTAHPPGDRARRPRGIFRRTTLAELKRATRRPCGYLFRENTFHPALLNDRTGIVPPDDFTLAPGDTIRITIDPIGTLEMSWSREDRPAV